MPAGFRRQRAAEDIRRELTAVLAEGLPGSRTPPVFFTRVELGPGYEIARVFLMPAVPGEMPDEAALIEPLERARGYLRKRLARRLDLRRTPQLEFRLDPGRVNEQRVETLLKRIAKRSKPLAAVVIAILLSCAARADDRPVQLERFEATASAMGSAFRIALYGRRLTHLASTAEAAFEEARRIDSLLSNYRADSELSRINREAASKPVRVSDEMFRLLERCLDYSRASDGAFDLTVGPLMKTWGFFKGAGKPPSRIARARARADVGYGLLELNRRDRSVRFLRSGVQLDPGGIGKGYAVDRMAALVRASGAVEAGLISAGTSSIYAVSAPPESPRGFKILVRDPRNPESTAAEVYLRDESLSTSGAYEKFFELDGRRYSHIMDPRSGMPARGVAAVSVKSASALDSEAWATALFVNGAEWTRRKAPPGLAVFLCPERGPCEWISGKR